jgi:hypothetical protein
MKMPACGEFFVEGDRSVQRMAMNRGWASEDGATPPIRTISHPLQLRSSMMTINRRTEVQGAAS